MGLARPYTVLYKEGATQAQEDEAQWILEALDFAYPDHPWYVRVYDGGFFIRHLEFPTNYGMNCKHRYASASELKRDVILKAGEWLERAGLRRGRGDPDQEEYRVEGVPEKFQPAHLRLKPAINIEALADIGKQAELENKELLAEKK